MGSAAAAAAAEPAGPWLKPQLAVAKDPRARDDGVVLRVRPRAGHAAVLDELLGGGEVKVTMDEADGKLLVHLVLQKEVAGWVGLCQSA